MDTALSENEKVFAIDGIGQGVRNDGRSLLDFRPIIVEFGVMQNVHGSARVKVGSTDMIATSRLRMRQVESTKTFSNRVDFYVTCSAIASPDFAGRKGDECAKKVTELLKAAYRNDKILPELQQFKLSNDRYYQTKVDIVILQYDGNVVDAAAIAAKAALSDLKFVLPTMLVRDGGKTTPQLPTRARSQVRTLDVTYAPMIATLNLVGDKIFIDADLYEEQCASGVVHVGIIPPKGSTAFDADLSDPSETDLVLLKNSVPHIFHAAKFDELAATGVTAAVELNRAVMKRINEHKTKAVQDTDIRRNTFLES